MPKHESKPLRTTAEVIAALGHARISRLTGCAYKRVWDWGKADTFPARYFLVMWVDLVALGFSAPPTLWGQTLSRNKEAVLTVKVRKMVAAA